MKSDFIKYENLLHYFYFDYKSSYPLWSGYPGFGFLKNVAIDQHVLARNRQFDMFDILRNRPELLGIGIDESTALIVKGEIFEVVGKSYVVVYDGKFWSREGSEFKNLPEKGQIFYFLSEGDRYNLRERKIIDKASF